MSLDLESRNNTDVVWVSVAIVIRVRFDGINNGISGERARLSVGVDGEHDALLACGEDYCCWLPADSESALEGPAIVAGIVWYGSSSGSKIWLMLMEGSDARTIRAGLCHGKLAHDRFMFAELHPLLQYCITIECTVRTWKFRTHGPV